MGKIDKLIEKAYKNNMEINIEDVAAITETEDEYFTLLKALEQKNIKIITENEIETENNNREYFDTGKCEDEFTLYLKDISRYPLLTPQEEKDLFTKYEKLRNVESLEKKELRDKLINSNLKLVISIAKKFIISLEKSKLNLLDIIQSGNIGLMTAVERFDVKKGFKFSTYATWWIKQAIDREIKNSYRTIRIPVHAEDLLVNIKKYQDRYFKENGKDCTVEEIAEHFNKPIETISLILNMSKEPLSMECPMDEDMEDENFLKNAIHANVNVEKEVIEKIDNTAMMEFVESVLPQRAYDVIRYRYGFIDGKVRTLEEIGQMLGVTRERVRQIEARSLRIIRQKMKYKEKVAISKTL